MMTMKCTLRRASSPSSSPPSSPSSSRRTSCSKQRCVRRSITCCASSSSSKKKQTTALPQDDDDLVENPHQQESSHMSAIPAPLIPSASVAQPAATPQTTSKMQHVASVLTDPAVMVSLVGLTGTLIASAMSAMSQREAKIMEKKQQEEQAEAEARAEAERRVAARRDPLLLAAIDLEERLVAIATRNVLAQSGKDSAVPPSLPDFHRLYTMFLLSAFLGYIQSIQDERVSLAVDAKYGQYDLRLRRNLQRHLGRIRYTLTKGKAPLRIPSGAQRAIGELMLTTSPSGDVRVISFTEFLERMRGQDVDGDGWSDDENNWLYIALLENIKRDLDALADAPQSAFRRVVYLQNDTVRLVQLLDPDRQLVGGDMKMLDISDYVSGKGDDDMASSSVDMNDEPIQTSTGHFAWPWQITPHLSTSGVDVVEVDKKAVAEVDVGPDGEEILPVETIDDDDDDAKASVDAMK